MDCTCLRHTELPGTTKLFADFVYHYDRLSDFYSHNPWDPGAFHAAAAEIAYPEDRRAALVAALAPINPGNSLLGKLAQPNTVAVVTGQQVGLFSGPAYTIYKALTAVRLARYLEEQGLAAVPVFWLATQDHDFEEIRHSWTFDASHRPVRLSVEKSGPEGAPVGTLPLPDLPLAALKEALAALPFGDDVVGLVEAAYRPGRTHGEAFRRLLASLLPDVELLFVDPMLPALRELAAPLLSEALTQAPELSAAIAWRGIALAERGYHAQVHFDEHTSLVFLLENGRRQSLKRHGREYLLGGRKIAAAELADRAADLSPNALLRPVVQDYLLPTVAYVGGPAELAYLAQSEVLYRHLLRRMPVALPRSGFTLFDHRAYKLLRRYEIGGCTNPLADFFQGEEHLRNRIASVLIPKQIQASMESARGSVRSSVDRLLADLHSFDPTLAAALEVSRRKIGYQLDKAEGKIRREAVRRDERASSDAAYLAGLVYPEGHLQERFYSILPFLARHGVDLAGRIYENVRLACPDHQILSI